MLVAMEAVTKIPAAKVSYNRLTVDIYIYIYNSFKVCRFSTGLQNIRFFISRLTLLCFEERCANRSETTGY